MWISTQHPQSHSMPPPPAAPDGWPPTVGHPALAGLPSPTYQWACRLRQDGAALGDAQAAWEEMLAAARARGMVAVPGGRADGSTRGAQAGTPRRARAPAPRARRSPTKQQQQQQQQQQQRQQKQQQRQQQQRVPKKTRKKQGDGRGGSTTTALAASRRRARRRPRRPKAAHLRFAFKTAPSTVVHYHYHVTDPTDLGRTEYARAANLPAERLAMRDLALAGQMAPKLDPGAMSGPPRIAEPASSSSSRMAPPPTDIPSLMLMTPAAASEGPTPGPRTPGPSSPPLQDHTRDVRMLLLPGHNGDATPRPASGAGASGRRRTPDMRFGTRSSSPTGRPGQQPRTPVAVRVAASVAKGFGPASRTSTTAPSAVARRRRTEDAPPPAATHQRHRTLAFTVPTPSVAGHDPCLDPPALSAPSDDAGGKVTTLHDLSAIDVVSEADDERAFRATTSPAAASAPTAAAAAAAAVATAPPSPSRKRWRAAKHVVVATNRLTADDERKLRAMFDFIDRGGDGLVNVREMLLALRKSQELADLLHLPMHIRQEDGTREAFETMFQKMDQHDLREVTFKQFIKYVKAHGHGTGSPRRSTRKAVWGASTSTNMPTAAPPARATPRAPSSSPLEVVAQETPVQASSPEPATIATPQHGFGSSGTDGSETESPLQSPALPLPQDDNDTDNDNDMSPGSSREMLVQEVASNRHQIGDLRGVSSPTTSADSSSDGEDRDRVKMTALMGGLQTPSVTPRKGGAGLPPFSPWAADMMAEYSRHGLGGMQIEAALLRADERFDRDSPSHPDYDAFVDGFHSVLTTAQRRMLSKHAVVAQAEDPARTWMGSEKAASVKPSRFQVQVKEVGGEWGGVDEYFCSTPFASP